jgi:hypothetical protein
VGRTVKRLENRLEYPEPDEQSGDEDDADGPAENFEHDAIFP